MMGTAAAIQLAIQLTNQLAGLAQLIQTAHSTGTEVSFEQLNALMITQQLTQATLQADIDKAA